MQGSMAKTSAENPIRAFIVLAAFEANLGACPAGVKPPVL
jgi:hypothetical protein